MHKLQPTDSTHAFNTHSAAAYLMDVAEKDVEGMPLVAVDISTCFPLMRMVIAMHDVPTKLEAVLEAVRAAYPRLTSRLSDVVEASVSGEMGESQSA